MLASPFGSYKRVVYFEHTSLSLDKTKDIEGVSEETTMRTSIILAQSLKISHSMLLGSVIAQITSYCRASHRSAFGK